MLDNHSFSFVFQKQVYFTKYNVLLLSKAKLMNICNWGHFEKMEKHNVARLTQGSVSVHAYMYKLYTITSMVSIALEHKDS